MRIIFSLFIVFQSFTGYAQTDTTQQHTDLPVIKDFVEMLSNDTVQTDVILSNFIIVENPNDELYDYLLASLQEIRINLMSKNIEQIEYTSFNEMPRKEIQDIDLENLNANHIYFLHYKKRQMLALYLKENKIASFTLVSKGNNKAHFVLY